MSVICGCSHSSVSFLGMLQPLIKVSLPVRNCHKEGRQKSLFFGFFLRFFWSGLFRRLFLFSSTLFYWHDSS